ncbi:MAG: tRNA lysidine(34) synthetase TilS [Vicinamibacterales bacterium]|nr:tRNA lysidine(34) synthetase TilS [Vicinamibacterales bacterium]
MHALAERVFTFLSREGLIPEGARVAVAVSGGGDSVALWCLLAELTEHARFAVVGLAHLNHQLRGRASDADARFCDELASRAGLPGIVESIDVAAIAQTERISLEHAGHRARHTFFDRAAGRLGATHVALGHTLDDQAETYLLRLLRGAGAAGLSAMRPRLGRIVRPLLQVRRVELREYLTLRGVSFREDASNQDQRVSRNRVRHDLLPHLGRYAPRVVEALAREAEIARADDEWLDRAAHESHGTLVKTDTHGVTVDADGLAALHPALSRRVVRRLLAGLSDRACGFAHVERVRAMAAGSVPRVDLPGLRAERRGRVIYVARRAGRGAGRELGTPFEYQLDVPGEVAVPEAAVTLRAERGGDPGPGGSRGAAPIAVGDATRELTVSVQMEAGPLRVRNWRPGDWYRPAGLNGHRKKLQDLFVDRKVERPRRHRVPVVVDARDRVMWVVGFGLSEDFRVTEARAREATVSMIILTVRPLGDQL